MSQSFNGLREVVRIEPPQDESRDINKEKENEELREKKLSNDNAAQNIQWRDFFAKWVTVFSTIYMIVVLLLVIASYTSPFWLKMSDTVLCTLLGTTAVNILGLTKIVIKGFFENHK